jgi:hypothetical protein
MNGQRSLKEVGMMPSDALLLGWRDVTEQHLAALRQGAATPRPRRRTVRIAAGRGLVRFGEWLAAPAQPVVTQ